MSKKLWESSMSVMIYLGFLSIFPFVKKFYKLKVLSNVMHSFFTKLTDDAFELRQCTTEKNQSDCLSYLLELMRKKNWTLSDLMPHTVTLYLDTYETTSVAIAQCLYQLGAHENVQWKLRQEISKNLSGNDGKINLDKLSEMEYLDQIFHG